MILLAILLSINPYDGIIPDEILTKEITVLVIGRTDCSACVKMKPIVKELQDEGYKISYTNDDEIRTKYNVYAVPVTIVLENLQEVNRVEGFLSKDELSKFFKES